MRDGARVAEHGHVLGAVAIDQLAEARLIDAARVVALHVADVALLEARDHVGQQAPPPSATPPSRNATRSRGKRRVTPPMNSALASASPAAAKWPTWLNM